MLPWFKVISAAAAALGITGLVLYETMTEEQQVEADDRARDLAAAASRARKRLTGGQSEPRTDERLPA